MKARSILAILVVVAVGAMIAGEARAQKEISCLLYTSDAADE